MDSCAPGPRLSGRSDRLLHVMIGTLRCLTYDYHLIPADMSIEGDANRICFTPNPCLITPYACQPRPPFCSSPHTTCLVMIYFAFICGIYIACAMHENNKCLCLFCTPFVPACFCGEARLPAAPVASPLHDATATHSFRFNKSRRVTCHRMPRTWDEHSRLAQLSYTAYGIRQVIVLVRLWGTFM
jgi:hypothetical protein